VKRFLVSMLTDVTTNRLYVVSTRTGVINVLHQSDGTTLNRCHWNETPVVGGGRVETLGALHDAPPNTWVEYCFDPRQLRLVRDVGEGGNAITPEDRRIARLYQRKVEILRWIAALIMASRAKLGLPTEFDETVRGIKRRQALAFRESGYDMARADEFIFVWQYAEVYGVEPKEACDRILLEWDLFEAELWKTEGIQLSFWNRVAKAKALDDLDRVQDDFRREFLVNALV
jgi:hypothetical protein